MNDFKRRSSFGNKRTGGFTGRNDRQKFGDKNSENSFSRRDSRGSSGQSFGPAKFKATCADCGVSCEVPFRPSGERPVYCSDCFRGKEGGRPGQSNDRSAKSSYERNAAQPYVRQPVATNSVSTEQFSDLNRKVDEILSLLKTQKIIKNPLESLPLKTGKTKEVEKKVKAKPSLKKKKK